MKPNYILICCVINIFFILSTNCWKVIVERYEIKFFDEQIFNGNGSVSRFNRTTQIINGQGQLFQDLPLNTWINIKVFGQYSNKYVELPINYNRKICDIYNYEYKWVASDLNGKWPKSCPIKKGIYYIKDYVPNVSQFPSIPWDTNNFMGEGKVFLNDTLAGWGFVWVRTTRHDEYEV